MPKLDSTITISILLAICALFAPSITALINNHHHYKMRELELTYNARMHYSDLIYKNKYEAYQTFLNVAGDYCLMDEYTTHCAKVLAASQNALLLCDDLSKPLLLKFIELLDFRSSPEQHNYTLLLNEISNSFNRELSLLSMSSDNK